METDQDIVLSIVIPVYNEADNLPPLVERLQNALRSVTDSWEIIFVSDGSTDSSPALMKTIRKKNDRFHYMLLSRNFGHQAALTAGLTRARGRAVITMDADLQDPPELITKLFNKWDFGKGGKVIHAIPCRKSGISLYKRGTASIYYRTLARISGVPAPPPGDFRLMDREIVTIIKMMSEHSRFIRGLTSWVGFPQDAVRFERPPRLSGNSKYTTTKMLKLALDGITSFSTAPLRLASYLGFGCAFLSFIYAARILLLKILRGSPVQIKGWTSLIVTILFLGGIQLLTIGIIGEYLGRIGEEVKNRPRFIVSEED